MTNYQPRPPMWIAIATIAVSATTACESDAPPPAATVRDSLGIRIVEHPMDLVLPVWRLSVNPETVVGHLADQDRSHQFTEIRGAVRLSDGRLVVADWGSKEARYFAPDGRHLKTIGGQGEGPGEVRFLFSVDRMAGDTLVVGGWPIGYRYWFDHNGDFIRNQLLGPWFPGMLGRTLVDGSLILDTYEFGSYGNTLERWAAFGPDEDIRPIGLVERVSRDGTITDTIGTIRGETYHKTGVIRENFAMHALPFTPMGLVTWSREYIFVGHTETAEVRAFDMHGSLQMVFRWAPETVALTREDHDAFRDDVMAGLRNAQQQPSYRRWLSEISFPNAKPTFEALIADEEGFVWVRGPTPSADTMARWTVFGPNGVAAAMVNVPADIEVLDVDNTHFVGKRTDDLDVEIVVTYTITR